MVNDEGVSVTSLGGVAIVSARDAHMSISFLIEGQKASSCTIKARAGDPLQEGPSGAGGK